MAGPDQAGIRDVSRCPASTTAPFGGEVNDFLGCLDLPIKNARVEARHKFEPAYYRLYYKLKSNLFC